MNPKGALRVWSPHRDSSAVKVWKSWVSMRSSDIWSWCDSVEEADWVLVDATHGVCPKLTDMLLHTANKKGIALSPSFTDLPDTIWMFFRTPLQPVLLNQWLDHVIHGKHSPVSVSNEWITKHIASDAANLFLRLNRWVNLTQYGKFSLDMAPICIKLLGGFVPIENLVKHPKLCENEIRNFLQNCFKEGALDYSLSQPQRVKSSAHFKSANSLHFAKRSAKKNLVRRIFDRFLK